MRRALPSGNDNVMGALAPVLRTFPPILVWPLFRLDIQRRESDRPPTSKKIINKPPKKKNKKKSE
jgi:hypothetical protein